jgi:hypothetical protein
MPYEVKGKCVYRKDTGKKVGCTKGSVEKYLAALHANIDESTKAIPAKDLAMKHSQFIGTIENEIKLGIKTELSKDSSLSEEEAKAIATNNINKSCDYYSKKNESIKRLEALLRESIGLSVVDETPTEMTFQILSDDSVAGSISIKINHPDLGNDVLEILAFKMDPQYRTFKLAYDTLKALWLAYRNINKIVLSPADESVQFWTRLGFTKLNNNYYFLLRGH